MEQNQKWRKFLGWLIVSKREEIPFIVFCLFLVTFAVSRVYVYVTNRDIMMLLPENLMIRGVHIHHFIFGIIILAVVGFAALYDTRQVVHRRLAAVYGVGLGFLFDEFALWLKLENDYQARITYDAVMLLSLVFLNVIYFPGFWKRMGRGVKKVARVPLRLYFAVSKQRRG